MAKKKKKNDFQDYLVERQKKIVVEIDGKKFPLRRFTVKVDMEIKAQFHDSKQWVDALEKLDSESLCKTLWILMEPNDTYSTWDILSDSMSADPLEKAQMYASIAAVIMPSMPNIRRDMENGIKKLKAQMTKTK